MMMTADKERPAGLVAIDREMARQHADAIASFRQNTAEAKKAAASIKRTGRLLLLGMGGSHAVGRAVEPLYRGLGIDALALPLSEQLGQPLPLTGRTVIVTSQSGESAEVVRWFSRAGGSSDIFGLTLEGGSFLARTAPCLVGDGGTELAFAATRSLTVTLALHLAILAALGEDPAPALAMLEAPQDCDVAPALAALGKVDTIVTSGRRLQGVAEALALGLTELSRLPCFSLEGGQLRHGPMEMLGPKIGVILFRGNDPTSELVTAMALSVIEAGAPLVIFDASGQAPVAGAVTLSFRPASGMAAVFTMLPVAQRLMIAFADSRVDNAGTPVRTTKITRSE
ncbi:SIS domain-containing protein [bacterium M00.F.Ca.ET.141.01.1.1]|uniref:SIS domain-containing protein n=1 Tax=unclassified Mesorhizobium TaxID=325217 RepID=UPI000FD4738A|nr:MULTISPECIES: SIS domain-containing protein [unclassified Mesorhizobium]RUX06176.1 SIS domain-containing protein [Mesorhizobium sp. M8A.F.Ca.ET.023.01.1.1]RWC72955.1 MAG: SIS domain-containing protein [Mesorhizobium sp.]TGR40666.1 SIS domain-containing protein [bacterium M00.F.Ca.ET.199.01.1.1]TGU29357.1 SIS domain-containing protein [bacterium M00.F.Ca.ET.156.01.1.1]TGV51878.1 SIS domain-containing protein [bacterium M00.F.Ca.ET.141.01.1.1]TGV85798.1 SIS domain-containing protein [Mesorhi